MSTTALLDNRGTTHGRFEDNARNGQVLRDLYRSSPAWKDMDPVHKEALDMIACKLSRILSGQAAFDDHWKDIAGYATLALKACDPSGATEVAPGLYRANQSASVFKEGPS